MNAHTARWFCKFATSMFAQNSKLKEINEMKKNMDWQQYRPAVNKVVCDWLKPLIDMAGVKFVVKGQEKIPKDEPVIYTPNHSGAFDIPAMILSAPNSPTFMAKKELGQIPFLKSWVNAFDCVLVDRMNKESAHSSLQSAIDFVKKGRSLIVFPEGTRSKDGEIGAFRGGAMKIAMETRRKIIPVLIEGTRERLEATGNIVSGTVYVTYLEPIITKGLSKEDFFKMPGEIRELLQKKKAALAAERETF